MSTFTNPSTADRDVAPVEFSRPRTIDWRTLLFRAIALAFAALTLSGPGGVTFLIAPWDTMALDGDELHRWHAVDIAAQVSLLGAGGLLISALSPRRRTLTVHALLVALVSLAVFTYSLPPHGTQVVVLAAVIVVALIAAHPTPRTLFTGRIDRWNRGLLALVAGASPFLLGNAWENVSRQLGSTGSHAEMGHWAGAAALPVSLLVIGVLAATGRTGWGLVSGLLAATYAYVGVAALLLPRHDGSWGRTGGIVAIVLAVAYSIATARQLSER